MSIPTHRRSIVTIAVAASIALASAAFAAGTFTDDDGNIHEGAIEAIAAEGITKGCNPPVNDLYCPDDSVTRSQMAAFLVRAKELPAPLDDHFGDMTDRSSRTTSTPSPTPGSRLAATRLRTTSSVPARR